MACLRLGKVTEQSHLLAHLLPHNWVRVVLWAWVLTIHPCPSAAALLQTWPPA